MTEHLTSATLFALIAVLAAWLLRKQKAQWRHAILLAAVLRFAVPTQIFSTLGSLLARMIPGQPAPLRGLGDVTRNLLRVAPLETALRSPSSFGLTALMFVWGAGALLLLAFWLRRCAREVPSARDPNAIECAIRDASLRDFDAPRNVELRIVDAAGTPAVQGVRGHTLLLPDGLSASLDPAEFEAVIAHELAHVRRRDNLTAALVRVVVCVFWWHPLLWWMERRMLQERERACDEMVLARGIEPEEYVAGILKICRMAMQGNPGFAQATGSDLNSRVEQIMSIRNVPFSSVKPRIVFWALLAIAAILPVSGALLTAQTNPGAAAGARKGSELITIRVVRPSAGYDAPAALEQHRAALEHLKELLAAPASTAKMDTGVYARWLNEEVVYIIDSREAAAFKALTTDAERDQFIQQFWERRNPTPGSAENAFRTEYYRRLAYANSHFSAPEFKGIDSDRGRIYIVLGPPDEIDSHPRDGWEEWRYKSFDHSADSLILVFRISRSAAPQ